MRWNRRRRGGRRHRRRAPPPPRRRRQRARRAPWSARRRANSRIASRSAAGGAVHDDRRSSKAVTAVGALTHHEGREDRGGVVLRVVRVAPASTSAAPSSAGAAALRYTGELERRRPQPCAGCARRGDGVGRTRRATLRLCAPRRRALPGGARAPLRLTRSKCFRSAARSVRWRAQRRMCSIATGKGRTPRRSSRARSTSSARR